MGGILPLVPTSVKRNQARINLGVLACGNVLVLKETAPA
jgi:hypothetical protein